MPPHNWNTGLIILCLAAGNFALGKISLLLAIPPGYATAIWPPAGVALAAVLLFGFRVWPGILLASFLLNVGTGFAAGSLHALLKTVALPMGIALGSTLQALAAALVVKRFCGYPEAFERGEKVTRFLALAGPVCCVVAPAWGTACLLLARTIPLDRVPVSWATWWAGDTVGVLVFTPLMLVKLAPPRLSQNAKNLLEQKAAPLAILLLGMVLTVWYHGVTVKSVQAKGRIRFEAVADEMTTAIGRRMTVYQQMLYGGRGLFLASRSVDRSEWGAYVTSLNIQENYPGIQGLGFSAYFKSNQKAAAMREIMSDGFALWPEGDRPEYSCIAFLEPMDERNRRALGFDMWTHPVRHEAMERARDMDRATLSGRVQLLQETDVDVQNGVLLYVPIYRNGMPNESVEKRRRALAGWVFAPFRIDNLMKGILSTMNKGAHLEIYDRAEPGEVPLYSSDGTFGPLPKSHHSLYSDSKTLEIGGRRWELRFRSYPAFESRLDYSEPRLVLLGGFIGSGLLFFLTLTLFTTRTRAQAMAEAMTRELQETRERYEVAVKGSKDGIWDWNILTNEVYLSAQWKNMLGFSEDELRNNFETLKLLLHPEDRARTLAAIDNYLYGSDKEPTFDLMYRLCHKDGQYRWILARGIALRDASGKPYRMAGSHTDMTTRKAAEEQLRWAHIAIQEKEALLRGVIRHMPVALFLKDVQKDYRFIMWNDASEQMFGLTQEQVLGKNDYDFFSKEQADFFRKMDEKVMSQKDAVDVSEEPVDSASLGRIILHTVKVPLFDTQGRPQYLLGISENITERKKVESMKNEFISTVSHELRTPLTSIRGSLGIIIGGVTGVISGQVKDLLEIAHRNCERLVRLINDILDIEKIESGKMALKLEPHDLSSLIRAAIEANDPYAKPLDARLVVTGAVDGVKVNVDPDRFAQVMANLISNACKFSPKNGRVEVSAARREGSLRISVADHGPGIPEEFRGRIFQKFSQADASDGRQKGGTGLGLSIAKALVEGFGGRIGFDTSQGQGTTFFFDLPEWRLDLPPQVSAPSGRRRLLICEDSSDIARTMVEMLRPLELDVDVAYNAAQAKELLANGRYDAMTLDILMPGQDGLAFLREMREESAGRGLPVVVVSIFAEGEKKRLNAAELNVEDWLAKPVDPERLVASVRRAIRRVRRPSNLASVLYVEDEPPMQKLVATLMERVASITPASTLGEAKALLKNRAFDLVILDNSLPDGSGVELLDMVRGTPVILLSAEKTSEQVRKSVFAVLNRSLDSNDDFLRTVRNALKPRQG